MFGAFSFGSVALIGRLAGASDRRSAGAALRGSLALALDLGLLAAFVGGFLIAPLVGLCDEAGDAASYG